MSIIYEPHVCDTPKANNFVPPFTLVPIYEEGTIWRCEECGTCWRYTIPLYGEWRRVRFWNLLTRHRIRKAAR